MPHTITKNHRPKRVDSRPNSNVRKHKNREAADQQEAQDIRVTKKNKHERQEREVDTSEKLKTNEDDIRVAKKIKALNKKLTAIEALKDKQSKGETLDDKQLAKLESLSETLQMLDDFMSGKRT